MDPQTSKTASAMSNCRFSSGIHTQGGNLEAFLSPKRKLDTRATSSKKSSTALQHDSTHFLDDASSSSSSPLESNGRSMDSSYDKSRLDNNDFAVDIPFNMPYDGEHSLGRFASRSTTRSQSKLSAAEYPTPSSSSSSALKNNQSFFQLVNESAGKGRDPSERMPVSSSSPESSPDSCTITGRKCNFDGSPLDRNSNSAKRSTQLGRRIGVKCSGFGGDSDDETKSSTNSGVSKNSKLMSQYQPSRCSSSRNSDDDRHLSNESDSNYFSALQTERRLPTSRSLLSTAREDYSQNGSRISSPSENTMNMERLNCNASKIDESFLLFDPVNRDPLRFISGTFLGNSVSEASCIRKIGQSKVVHGTPFSNYSSPMATKGRNDSILMESRTDGSKDSPGNWANDTDIDIDEYNYSNSFVMSTPPAELRDLGTPVRIVVFTLI